MARNKKAESVIETAGIEPEIEDIPDAPLVAESEAAPDPVESYKEFSAVKEKSQAERDLSILLQAQEIRQDSERFKAAKAIAGGLHIG